MRPKDVERTRPPNAPRKLAPVAPTGSEQPGVICTESNTSQPPLKPSQDEGSIHVAPPDQADRPGNDGWHAVENDVAVSGSDFDIQINDFSDDGDTEAVDGEDDEYCESAGSESDIQRWRPLLEKLLSRSKQYPKLDAMDIELMAHLLCLYWSHINSEWGPLPAIDDFFAPFGSGQCPMSLLMAR
ncbi:hypothetical protein E8E14_004736 [Neopestalotiopsis sp. 37M]|nr:hypothetical protein E8E14_004736 [Neopestalotiopsis sp. 37M]